MRAIQTALHALSSLGLTGTVFGLPLGLFLTSNLFYTPPEELITTVDDRTAELASWVLPTPSPMSIEEAVPEANEDALTESHGAAAQGTRTTGSTVPLPRAASQL